MRASKGDSKRVRLIKADYANRLPAAKRSRTMLREWTRMHPRADTYWLGFIPRWLSEDDPRPAREQLDANYRHGGGWVPTDLKFKMDANGNLRYPGDPPVQCLWEGKLRDEIIRIYEYEWVAIVQPDGSFEICRMD